MLLLCSDSVSDEVIGTHFIDLSRISNDGANGMNKLLAVVPLISITLSYVEFIFLQLDKDIRK